MQTLALILLCLSFLLFAVPPIVARGWDAVADWKTRPEPKILGGGLVALFSCIILVPASHSGLLFSFENGPSSYMEAGEPVLVV